MQPLPERKATTAKLLIGHKGRAFDIRFNSAKQQVLSASEDGTCKLWNYSTGKCSKTIIHNKEAEVLRAAFLSNNVDICTTGSDGNAVLWKNDIDSKLEKCHTFSHGEEAQIYVCETIDSDLLIAADDFMVFWDLISLEHKRIYTFRESGSLSDNQGPSFGGHRNPDNQVFVFDAKLKPNSAGSVVGVALSDSTTRLLDTRSSSNQAFASVSLARLFAGTSERIGHATSLSWSEDANTLAVSLGSGQTALIDTRQQQVRALLRGGGGAPCYGSLLVGGGSTCLSWSSDTCLRVWDASAAQGLCDTPISQQIIPDFPILAAAWDTYDRQLICGGGGGVLKGAPAPAGPGMGLNRVQAGFSFIGTPIHILKNVLSNTSTVPVTEVAPAAVVVNNSNREKNNPL